MDELISIVSYQDNGQLVWTKAPRRGVAPNTEAGSLKPDGYKYIGYKGKVYCAHRVVFYYHHGYLPEYVDHINHNRSDNRIENLRAATPSENQCNRVLNRNNTSGVKGVTWNKNRNKWQASICFEGKVYNLGRFEKLEDAEAAVAKKRIEVHGQYARS